MHVRPRDNGLGAYWEIFFDNKTEKREMLDALRICVIASTQRDSELRNTGYELIRYISGHCSDQRSREWHVHLHGDIEATIFEKEMLKYAGLLIHMAFYMGLLYGKCKDILSSKDGGFLAEMIEVMRDQKELLRKQADTIYDQRKYLDFYVARDERRKLASLPPTAHC